MIIKKKFLSNFLEGNNLIFIHTELLTKKMLYGIKF